MPDSSEGTSSEGITLTPSPTSSASSIGSQSSTRPFAVHPEVSAVNSNHGDDNDDDACSCVSQTSTEMYEYIGHEPFATFKEKVEEVCHSVFPMKKSKFEAFAKTGVGRFLSRFWPFHKILPQQPSLEIYHMSGGSFNRVVGITLHNYYKRFGFSGPKMEYVLRIPREAHPDPKRALIMAHIVGQEAQVPLPKVVHCDFGEDNAFKKPYVIYERIPGQTLDEIVDKLTVSQKCGLAKQVASILRSMRCNTKPTTAKMKAIPYDAGDLFNSQMSIIPLHTTDYKPERAQFFEDELPSDKLVDNPTWNFYRRLNSRRIQAEKLYANERHLYWFLDLEDMLEEMIRLNVIGDPETCVCHMDLLPRNIMAEIDKDQNVNITGIIDWDSAILGPEFLGCCPPWWLWSDSAYAENGFNEDDETCARETPSDPEKAEIKAQFDDLMDDYFKTYAYTPIYRMLRTIFKLTQGGLGTNEECKEFQRMEQEWPDIRAEFSSGQSSSDEDSSGEDSSDEDSSEDGSGHESSSGGDTSVEQEASPKSHDDKGAPS